MFRHMSDIKYFYTLKLAIALKCIKQNRQLSGMIGTKVIILKLLSICCFQIKEHWRVCIIFFAAHSHFWPKILKSTHTHLLPHHETITMTLFTWSTCYNLLLSNSCHIIRKQPWLYEMENYIAFIQGYDIHE
jgi:hypothetical protein